MKARLATLKAQREKERQDVSDLVIDRSSLLQPLCSSQLAQSMMHEAWRKNDPVWCADNHVHTNINAGMSLGFESLSV
jgi:hypothetical protein